MSVRLNWPGSRLDNVRYDAVAWYFAAFHDMWGQDPAAVLTKEEYIARADCAYDKLGPRDDVTGYVFWEGNDTWEPRDETYQIALIKIGDPRRRRYDGDRPVARRAGHCEMFRWNEYNEDPEESYDFV